MWAGSPFHRAGAAVLKALSPYFALLVRGLSRLGAHWDRNNLGLVKKTTEHREHGGRKGFCGVCGVYNYDTSSLQNVKVICGTFAGAVRWNSPRNLFW